MTGAGIITRRGFASGRRLSARRDGDSRPRADLDIVTETSVTEFRWTTASTVSEGELFAINGENVWSHKWLETGDDAVQLPHPDYPAQTHRFNVYRIEKLAGEVRFAASEVSPNVWAFYA